MAIKSKVETRDLTVLFYEKSFRVKDMSEAICTGRSFTDLEMTKVGESLQRLVERGKHKSTWRERSQGLRSRLHNQEDIESWQAQEIEALKDTVADLETQLLEQNGNINWCQENAIGEG